MQRTPKAIARGPAHRALKLLLRALGLIVFAAGCLHFFLGFDADALVGISVPHDLLNDPSLDSQNRFFGTVFACQGVLIGMSASNLVRFKPLLCLSLIGIWAGGIGRLASLILHGWPAWPVVGLALTELLVPPLLIVWLSYIRH